MSRGRMTHCALTAALLLTAGLACPLAPAQFQQPPYPQLPPLLYVRLSAPAGARVTLFRGGPTGQTVEAPFVVGLRPGFLHRIQISDIPGHPGLTLFPTLEVRGSLLTPPKMRAADHPASLLLTEQDVTAVRNGALVTRVIAVERPEHAVPVATTPNRPLEFSAPPGTDPVKEAQQHGRVLLVMHVGQRQMHPSELAFTGVPGTILMPGEKVLPPPRDPPCVPWTVAPIWDPKLGPYSPCEEMCFHDGGDGGLPAGIDPAGKLRGLDPSDTVGEYVDSTGKRRVVCSNKVCLCVPRFITTRGETGLEGNRVVLGPRDANATQAQQVFRGQDRTVEWQQREHVARVTAGMKAAAVEQWTTTAVIGRVDGIAIVGTVIETRSVTGSCLKPEPPPPPEGKLIVIKWPDRCDLKIGDVVTFFLKYTNRGGRPISDVAVSDSLTGRLEYVPGSARSDRAANFTTQPNEAGSLALRWEIAGELLPGQSGVVSFQARVR